MFYTFRQNNSGGYFNIDETVTINVVIEASSAVQANALAESFNIYFDGCNRGYDCACCGNRWYSVMDCEGETSLWLSESYEVACPSMYFSICKGLPYAYLYLANGTKQSWHLTKNGKLKMVENE